jgi:hypothetical protein
MAKEAAYALFARTRRTIMTNASSMTPSSGQLYKLVCANSGKVLDVDGGSVQDGAKVQQWTDHGGANQQWSFEAVGPVNGQPAYKLVCANSGKVLDVTGGSLQAGAAVVQWPYQGGANQQWYVLDVGNSTCTIQSVGSGKVLDVEGASLQDGAQVLQWDDHNGANQHWFLLPVPSQPSATSQPVTVNQTMQQLIQQQSAVQQQLQLLAQQAQQQTLSASEQLEMQMLMNQLSQLSEMLSSLAAASNTAVTSITRSSKE